MTTVQQMEFALRQLQVMLTYRSQLEALMTDVDQAVADLTAEVAAVGARVQTDIDTLKQQLADAASLSESERQQLQATADSIEAQVANLQSVDPAAAPPPTPGA